MQQRLCKKHIVLLGVGHTNAHIVRMWSMKPIPDVDLTCLSNYPIATYSGMLPAALAGQIAPAQMEIDLVRLCASAQARLLTERVLRLDHTRQRVELEGRPPIPFDVLSIGIGSIPTTEGVSIGGDSLVKIKPMQTFLQRLGAAVESRRPKPGHPLRVMIVGSGVAGIEIAFCLPPFLSGLGVPQYHLHIVTRSGSVLPNMSAGCERRVSTELDRRGYTVTVGKGVVQVLPDAIELEDGQRMAADVVIWATGATAAPVLGQLGLPQDESGFIATDHTLRSLSGQPIFAVGDSGSIAGEGLPKAGVYAVRQAPVLWENIGRVLDGRPLRRYIPQRSFLKLVNLGDGRAIAQYRGLTFSGRWVKRWKDRIDQRFIAKYQPPTMQATAEPMQCLGCGSKLGSGVLHSGLAHWSVPSSLDCPSRVLGPNISFEDAIEISSHPHPQLIASTDFFSSPLSDAFLSGRVTALHSASDVVVCGGRVTHALANVVLPAGDPQSQADTLGEFLAGARLEFNMMGGSVVGGHTIVGPRMEVGFTVIGTACGPQLLRKANLRAGDQLYLTKPLGVGVLLAAHRMHGCAARDYAELIELMLRRQHEFAQLASELGVLAATDVTGFGLCGHLLEMLLASDVRGTLYVNDIPLLPSALRAIEEGYQSSLFEDNFQIDSQITAAVDVRVQPRYRALFDPQTCGGFLFGCSEEVGSRFLQRAMERGWPAIWNVGEVHSAAAEEKRLSVALCRA